MSYSYNSSLQKTLPGAKEYCSKQNETLLDIDDIADFSQSVRDQQGTFIKNISSFWIQSCDENGANIRSRAGSKIHEFCSANTRLCERTPRSSSANEASKTTNIFVL